MEYRILGPLEVVKDGSPLDVGGFKQRAFLAVLLIHVNQVVSTDQLMDELWGDEPPDSAPNVLQTYVSRLRKAFDPSRAGAGSSPLVTRSPGYVLVVGPSELDAQRFEQLAQEGREALDEGDPKLASRRLAEALSLWRGPPLADFTYERFARTEIERLEEARLSALEDRLDADLAAGKGAELIGELHSLVAQHPLRERLRAQLMVALYRAGRQAEALETYRDLRRALSTELGIEPGPDLQKLEIAILNQDPALHAARLTTTEAADEPGALPLAERSILVAPRNPARLEGLLTIAESLTRIEPPHDLVLARLLGTWEQSSGGTTDTLATALQELGRLRGELAGRSVPARVVAFTSDDPAHDLARLVSDQPVELLLTDGSLDMFESHVQLLAPVLERVECDIAILLHPKRDSASASDGRPVLTPFGGAAHDWAALQMAAALARARRVPLQLLGSRADLQTGRRDASRLLAHASLIVQQSAGVVAEPVLVDPGEGVLRAARGAGLVVLGLSERWQREGLGALRSEIARSTPAPTLILRRGSSSAAPASGEDLTRFSWSRAGDIPVDR